MTDFTIFSCLLRAIFLQLLLNSPVAEEFAKQLLVQDSHSCIQNDSVLHLMRVQGKTHVHLRSWHLEQALLNRRRNQHTLKTHSI